MKIIILSLLLTLSITTAKTDEPDPASFFPSAVGNVWEFNTDHGFVREVFYRDSLAEDGSRYISPSAVANYNFRFDTSHCVYYLPFSLNWKIYKLNAELGETWKVEWDRRRQMARVDNIYTAYLWGAERYIKEIGYYRLVYPDSTITDNSVHESYILLISGIGEYYEFDFESGPVRALQGCIIDGDTLGIITSVNDTDQDIPPNDIALFQNYPNPFNPSTNIEYAIYYTGKVNLTVYDVLGRKVTTLVNEYQSTGAYQVQFSVKDNQLSSGIYLYRLTINNTTRTKKMIYAK